MYKDAILNRKSRRTFSGKLPEISHIRMLKDQIDDINERENLSVQLVIDSSDGFSGASSYGVFRGVRNYIALIGPESDENVHEKLGYYGEQLLLACETLGYGTCWVGGTFSREKCRCRVEDDEVFVCAIVFGSVKKRISLKEKAFTGAVHTVRKTKKIEDLFYSQEQPPNWFIEGMRMVQKAPSAMNRMPVKFYYSGGAVSARVKEPEIINYYDLGIAKYHFLAGAGRGSWEFGNGGIFTV